MRKFKQTFSFSRWKLTSINCSNKSVLILNPNDSELERRPIWLIKEEWGFQKLSKNTSNIYVFFSKFLPATRELWPFQKQMLQREYE